MTSPTARASRENNKQDACRKTFHQPPSVAPRERTISTGHTVALKLWQAVFVEENLLGVARLRLVACNELADARLIGAEFQ